MTPSDESTIESGSAARAQPLIRSKTAGEAGARKGRGGRAGAAEPSAAASPAVAGVAAVATGEMAPGRANAPGMDMGSMVVVAVVHNAYAEPET